MTFTCSWCLLAGYTTKQATKPGEPAAYAEGTGEPICPDCADEQDGATDATKEAAMTEGRE